MSKIGRIAVSCVHDLQSRRLVAETVFAEMTCGDDAGCESKIKELGAVAAQGRNVQCIVTFANEEEDAIAIHGICA